MKIARLGLSGIPGFAVTSSLLILMYTLIEMGDVDVEEKDYTPLADIWQDKQELEDNFKKFKPKKPEEKEPPPPRMAREQAEMEEVVEVVQSSAPRLDAKVSIAVGGLGGDGEYRPTRRVQPRYPQRALERGLEGYVIVEFSISTTGDVINPVVIEGMNTTGAEPKPTSMFNKEALRAAKKLKYKPRIVDEQPVEVTGVRYQFTFELDADSKK